MRRIVLAFALCACASPALAVQDRYGPPRTEPAVAARAAPLPAGMTLDWHGKAAAHTEPVAPQRPEPIAPWARRLAPPAAQPAVAAAQPAPSPPRVLPPPASAPQPYRLQPPATRIAAAAPAPTPTAQAPGAGGRPRFYSVARQYGAEPDPIPVAPPPQGQALTLSEVPATENLGRTYAPLDDGRANQAVAIPVTKENAASNRISRFGP